ncbi:MULTISPECIES: SRPBCC domain-containing protein [unclassified Pseudoxanthomonas]|uniref:SRPBCC family protein n=1 Tax=unclassified Pseudoxanthomonas TaxID=2645906 RepID=UPI00307770AF
MPGIHHEVLIGATAEKIYAAITREEGLSAWWTPGAKAKPERGSVSRFAFGPDYFKEMKVTTLKPSEQVEWTCITGVDEWVGTTVSFELHAGDKESLLMSHPEAIDQIQQARGTDTETLLILHHDGWKDYTPMFAECNYTWGQFLRSLKLLCETGHGRPWPHQHDSRP